MQWNFFDTDGIADANEKSILDNAIKTGCNVGRSLYCNTFNYVADKGHWSPTSAFSKHEMISNWVYEGWWGVIVNKECDYTKKKNCCIIKGRVVFRHKATDRVDFNDGDDPQTNKPYKFCTQTMVGTVCITDRLVNACMKAFYPGEGQDFDITAQRKKKVEFTCPCNQ